MLILTSHDYRGNEVSNTIYRYKGTSTGISDVLHPDIRSIYPKFDIKVKNNLRKFGIAGLYINTRIRLLDRNLNTDGNFYCRLLLRSNRSSGSKYKGYGQWFKLGAPRQMSECIPTWEFMIPFDFNDILVRATTYYWSDPIEANDPGFDEEDLDLPNYEWDAYHYTYLYNRYTHSKIYYNPNSNNRFAYSTYAKIGIYYKPGNGPKGGPSITKVTESNNFRLGINCGYSISHLDNLGIDIVYLNYSSTNCTLSMHPPYSRYNQYQISQ